VPASFDVKLLSFFATMTFGFAGLELAPVMGDEIQGGAQTVRRAIAISGVLIALAYIVGTAALLVALPPETINITNGVPQASAAIEQRLGLRGITVGIAVMLVIGNLGGVGAWLAGSARIPFVAGLDRKLPAAFGKIHPRWQSPYVALLVQGGVASLFVLIGLIGGKVEAGYLVLLDTTIVLYFIPYVYLFAVYVKMQRSGLSESRESSGLRGWRGAGTWVGWMGLLTVLLSIALAVVPAETSQGVWLFEAKLWGGVLGFMGVGCWLVRRARVRETTSPSAPESLR